MISTPKSGWAIIQIGDWKDRVSYLSDVPFILLDAFIEAKSKYDPISVKFDAEGWEYIIVFDYEETYVLDYGYTNESEYLKDTENKMKLFSFEISKEMIVKELIHDLEMDLYAWAMWTSADSDTTNKRKAELQHKIIILKNIFNLNGETL